MNKGSVLAVLVVAAYVGLEIYTIRSASERMEPAYIHNLLIEAKTATELCESDALELRARFEKTLNRVAGSYRAELLADKADARPAQIDELLQEQVAAARSRVIEAVDATGCTDDEARAHFQRYRIYARKTR